jgi:hypothetical protein
LGFRTVEIVYEGKICEVGDEVVFQEEISTDADIGYGTLCTYNDVASSVSGRIEDSTNFWYDMTTVLSCQDNPES